MHSVPTQLHSLQEGLNLPCDAPGPTDGGGGPRGGAPGLVGPAGRGGGPILLGLVGSVAAAPGPDPGGWRGGGPRRGGGEDIVSSFH